MHVDLAAHTPQAISQMLQRQLACCTHATRVLTSKSLPLVAVTSCSQAKARTTALALLGSGATKRENKAVSEPQAWLMIQRLQGSSQGHTGQRNGRSLGKIIGRTPKWLGCVSRLCGCAYP